MGVGINEGVGAGVGVGVRVGVGVGVAVGVGVETKLKTFPDFSPFTIKMAPGITVKKTPTKKYFHTIFIFRRRIIAVLERAVF